MKKILLTSTGFENENIKKKFLKLLNKNINDIRVLFVITAANDPEAVRILSKCLDDLTNCNIKDENIVIYDMHKPISNAEIIKYDAIYVCGGSTKHLLERMNEIKFKDTLKYYIDNEGIYIGVSAGSVAFGTKYPDGLGLMENKIYVHCDTGSNNGIIGDNEDINLTNNQAICYEEENRIIFE